jgi:hypothetical protein
MQFTESTAAAMIPGLPCQITWTTSKGKTNTRIAHDHNEAVMLIDGIINSLYGSTLSEVTLAAAIDRNDELELVGPTVEVTLPHRFYDDHVDRAGRPGEIVRTMKSGVRVVLDVAAYDDMMSDATYYSDARDFDRDLAGLAASARATIQRLARVGRPG